MAPKENNYFTFEKKSNFSATAWSQLPVPVLP